MKIFKILIIIIAFIIILLPLAFINLKADQISEIDNEKLPEVSTIKNVQSLQNFLSKRIGFRSSLINIYTEANDKLFGEMIHPTYTYGINGYIFFKTNVETHDDKYFDSFANLLKNIQKYVTDRGSYFLFVLNPTKISVYSQYLPRGYNFTDYRVSYLKNKLDELGVNYIDNTKCLKEASKNEQVYNIKYDAGHWNDLGAFYGINSIYNKMKSDNLNISQLKKEDYNISYIHQDTLPVSKFKISEDTPDFKLKNVNYSLDNRYNDSIERSKSYSYYLETINNNVDNSYNLLFYRESYMSNKEKFISNKFAHVYYVHNYTNSINFDYYYNIATPDIVLFETVEYTLKDNYYPIKLMDNKKFNELYQNFSNLPEKKFIQVDTNKITEIIKKNYNSNVPLTKISIPCKDFKYAYMIVKDRCYDFCYDNSDAYITLDTNLLNNNSIKLIFISDDLSYKEILNV